MMNDLSVSVDAGNHFYLMLRDVINYNDLMSTLDSCESVKNVRFTDI